MAERRFVARYDVTARDTGSPVLEQGARRVATAQRGLRRELTATEAASAAAQRSIQRYGQQAGRSASRARSAEAANRALDRSLERLVGSSARAARAHHQQATAADRARREVSRLGSTVRNAAALVGAGSVLFGGAAVIRQATQYETALRDAGAMAELTAKQQVRLGDVSRRVGVQQALGATESAKAAGELAKAGIDFQAVVTGALKSTADLSNAGAVELPQAADAMAAAISDFKLQGRDAAHVADSLTSSSLSTRDSVEGVVRAFASGAAAAKEAGYSFDDTVTTLTLLAKAGQLGAVGGTTMRSAFLRMINPPKAAKAAIADYNLELFDSQGKLKAAAELSEELDKKLGKLSNRERSAVFKDLAGSYGFRALSAIARESGPDIDKLEVRLQRTGVAASIAQQRLTGLEGAQRKLKAAGQEASIRLSEGILPGLADVATASTEALGNRAVQRTLDRFGKQLGEKGQEFAAGFERAAEDGRLEDMLNGALSATTALAQTMTAVASAAGTIASFWHEIPEGVRESGIQALVFAAVLKRLAIIGGALPFVGALGRRAGAAGGAGGPGPIIGGAAGAGAAAGGFRGQMSTLQQLRAESRAQQAFSAAAIQRAQAQQTAAFRSANNASLAAARGPGQSTWLGSALAANDRQQRAAAEAARQRVLLEQRNARLAAESQRRAIAQQRSQMLRSMRPSAGAAAGVAAIGVGAAALSGGNTGTAALTGAMVGSMMGPMGAAGGALAAAAGSELIKIIRTRGEEASRKMGEAAGRAVAETMGRNLDARAQKSITALKIAEQRAADAARKASEGGPNARVDVAKDRTAFQTAQRLGAEIGRQGVANARGKLAPGTASIARDLIGRVQNESTATQKAAAQKYIAYVRELEKGGKLAKGATDRFEKIIGKRIAVDKDVTVKTRLRTDLQKDAGEIGKKLAGALKRNVKISLDVTKVDAKDVDIEKVLGTARRQRKELDDIIDGRVSSTKKEREAAKKARKELDGLIAAFDSASSKAREYERNKTVQKLDAERVAAKKAAEQFRDLAFAKSQAAQPEGSSAPQTRTPDNPDLIESPFDFIQRHTGGVVRRRFMGGGVAVAASAGEGMVFPDGSFGVVPGHQFPQDNVYLNVPDGTSFLTRDGLGLARLGASLEQVLAWQRPHYGEPQRFATGGTAGIGPARTAIAARKAGFTGSNLVTAVAVAGAESGYRPGATNRNTDGTIDRGLWQINSIHKSYQAGRLFEPGYNARAAWAISNHGTNWNPWYAWRDGKHQQYMAAARAAALRSRNENAVGESFDDQTVKVPILVGRARRNVTGLTESTGFARGQQYDSATTRRLGLNSARTIAEALAQVQTTREITARGGGGGGDSREATSGGVGGRGWGRPVSGPITSRYGARKSPGGVGSTNHDGVDFGVPVGTPIRAARYGTVTKAGPNGGYGNYIRLQHAGGYDSFYGHLSSIGVKLRERVRKGQTIGKSGNTGTSTGPHLHFGMAKNGASVDPLSVIKMRRGGVAARRFFSGGGMASVSHKDGEASALPLTPGRVRKGAPDVGKTTRRGDIVLRDIMASGGDIQSRIEKVLATIDDLTYEKVEAIRKQVQASANAGQTKQSRARWQAVLSAIDETLDFRVGRAVGGAEFSTSARQQNMQTLQTMQRIRGTDGAQANREQMAQEQRFLATAGARRSTLEKAVERAQRQADRNRGNEQYAQQLADAKKALVDFNAETMDARANIAELGRAAEEAARAQTEAALDRAVTRAGLTDSKADDAAEARRQYDYYLAQTYEAGNRGDMAASEDYRLKADIALKSANDFDAEQRAMDLDKKRTDRRSGLEELDRDAALAALTDSKDDDLEVAQRREQRLAAALEDAKANGDTQDTTDIAGQLKGVRDEIKGLRDDSAQQAEALLALEREKNQKLEARVAGLAGSERALAAFALAAVGEGVRSVSGLGNRDPYARTG